MTDKHLNLPLPRLCHSSVYFLRPHNMELILMYVLSAIKYQIESECYRRKRRPVNTCERVYACRSRKTCILVKTNNGILHY